MQNNQSNQNNKEQLKKDEIDSLKTKELKVNEQTNETKPKEEESNNQNLIESQKEEEEKKIAIQTEEHYRNLYHKYFGLDWNNHYMGLCQRLIDGYKRLIDDFKDDKTKSKEDIELIIKFAFRDFYLLIFINKNEIFNNDEFLKSLHREVYFANNYVNQKQFEDLVQHCKEHIENEWKK